MPYCKDCNVNKTKLKKDSLCKECSEKSPIAAGNTEERQNNVRSLLQTKAFSNDSEYWSNMNKPLDTKFSDF